MLVPCDFFHFFWSGFASTGVSKGGPISMFFDSSLRYRDMATLSFMVRFQRFFDLSLHHRDMATLSFRLTVANTYLYPVIFFISLGRDLHQQGFLRFFDLSLRN